MIRLLLVDDDALVRGGLRVLLDGQPDLAVVDEAADGEAAVRRCADDDIDVVLMDLRMAGIGGIEATRQITARRRARVLVVTTFTDEEYVFDALVAGASGFIPKRADPEALMHAIRVVARGEALVLPADTRTLVERTVSPRRRRLDPRQRRLRSLTPREADVLRLVAQGLSNAEIAAALTVSAETVKSHVGAVLAKVGARDRTQAVIFAYETGFVRAGAD